MSSKNPTQPFWVTAVRVTLGKLGKVNTSDFEHKDYSKIRVMYDRVHGSWVGLAEGDSDSWALLKKVAKVYCKKRKQKTSRVTQVEGEGEGEGEGEKQKSD